LQTQAVVRIDLSLMPEDAAALRLVNAGIQSPLEKDGGAGLVI
jgi:hypothetical protein